MSDSSVVPPAVDVHSRVLRGALECIEQHGLAKTTIEGVAQRAGLSRATVYRHFPGGRDQVVSETVSWEVARFLTRIEHAIHDVTDLEDLLTQALVVGHHALEEHRLLHQVLSTEREALVHELAANGPVVEDAVRAYLRARLEADEATAIADLDEAADYLARLYLSFLSSSGAWDLHDLEVARRLVRTQFLAGIRAR
jgi:AcrR family transcriptional regulator